MSEETEQRLERLEASVVHLERQVDELNEVLVEQGRLLASVAKQLQRQTTALETLELERIRSNNPPPPHH